jgi:hypothetical protein
VGFFIQGRGGINLTETDELRMNEARDFKKLLFLLSVTVIIATVIPRVLFQLLLAFLGAPAEEAAEAAEPVVYSEYAYNFAFFITWLLNHLFIFVPAFVIYGFAFRDKTAFQKHGEPYEFKIRWLLPIFIASYALSIVSNIITNIIAAVLHPVFGGEGLPDVFAEVMPQTTTQVIIMLVLVGLIGPVCEELIYRHLLLRPLRRYGDFQAIIITALLFGFFHGNFTQFLYTAVGGVIYGIVAVRANSVKPAIALHIINNVFVILLSHFYTTAEAAEDTNMMLILNLTPYAILASGIFIFIYFLVKKRFKTENHNPYIPAAERIRMIAENPLVLLLMIILIIDTVRGTLR